MANPDNSIPNDDDTRVDDSLRDLIRHGLGQRDALAAQPDPPVPPPDALFQKLQERRAKAARGAVVPFPSAAAPSALAARSPSDISPETRAKIADLVKDMAAQKPKPNARP